MQNYLKNISTFEYRMMENYGELSISNISFFKILSLKFKLSFRFSNPKYYDEYVKLSRFTDRLFVFHAKADYSLVGLRLESLS